MGEGVSSIVSVINELQEDNMLPKSVKTRLQEVCIILQNEDADSIKINKALDKLDQLSDDGNIEPFARTQIWNIVSMLASVGA